MPLPVIAPLVVPVPEPLVAPPEVPGPVPPMVPPDVPVPVPLAVPPLPIEPLVPPPGAVLFGLVVSVDCAIEMPTAVASSVAAPAVVAKVLKLRGSKIACRSG